MRWQYRDASLLWLYPPAYAIHVAEEWSAGFPAWTARVTGAPIPDKAFLIISGVGMVALFTAVRAAIRHQHHGWMTVAVATIFLVNTALHVASAVMTQSYAPGLISAVVLYVPLGLLTMIRAFDQAPRSQLTRGIVSGLVVHGLVLIVAFTATRLFR